LPETDGKVGSTDVSSNAQICIKFLWNGGFGGILSAIIGASANLGTKKIDVWDTAFSPVEMSFKDSYLAGGYSPYTIRAVGNRLFVMCAVLGTDGHGVSGAGKGIVSEFTMDGTFIRRFASNGTLNITWGVTSASASFRGAGCWRGKASGEGGYGGVEVTVAARTVGMVE